MKNHTHNITAARRIVRWTVNTVFLIGLAVAITIFALGVIFHIRAVPVLTGSMTPAYPVGALAVTQQVNTKTLAVGDVIAFQPPAGYSTPNNAPVMHRIVSIDTSNGKVQVKTKGDNNPANDPWAIDLTNQAMIQKTTTGVPHVGHVVDALKNADRRIAALSVAGLALIVLPIMWWPSRRKGCQCAECSDIRLARETAPETGDELLKEIHVAPSGVATLSNLGNNRDAGFVDWLAEMAKEDLQADWVLISTARTDSLEYLTAMGDNEVRHNYPWTDDIRYSMCWTIATTGQPKVVNDIDIETGGHLRAVMKAHEMTSYLGVPMIDSKGDVIGSFCIADIQPRYWHANELDALVELARLAADFIETSYVPSGLPVLAAKGSNLAVIAGGAFKRVGKLVAATVR